ncbi:uncharacterized protein LOC129808617 [Phlebotomus papatasi]|uniref:uncharacterized protein LOC129808617 n=1 Tax=Phlebotomus papatasi TaxID=29031 RepID=UPI002483AABD|nr:uncharacterized protein LOC129808617 [Phlebotomus papatasi]
MVFRTRGGIVSAVTRVQNYINGLSDASDEEINFIGYKANLISQLNLVKAMKAKYIGIQDDIIKGLPDGATKEAEIISKEDFIERCDDLISQIDTLILEAPQSSSDDSKRDPLSTSDMAKFFTAFITQAEQRHQQQMELLLSTLTNTASTNDTNTYCKTTKLPQTKLPTFDGKHASWKSFKDRFTSSVINVPNITNVQELDYLMSAVSGNAEACIKKLSMTDENFAVAWKILEDKFDDKNEIVSEYIKTFFAMPRMSSSGAQAIQEITNVFTECTMALDAMDVSQKDPWLIQYTLDRLDSESRVLWGRQCGTEVPTVSAFIKFLDQRCKDVKNSSSSSNKPSSNTSQNSRPNKPQLPKRQATALTNSANASSCRCCSESSHPLYKCPKFLNQTPGERFETVKTLSLCRNCFATHLTHSCTYHKCRKCQGRHNILLHDKYASDSSNRTDPASSSANFASNSGSPSSNHTSDSSAVVAVCASSESDHSDLPPRVFLATALVNILTANGEMIPCRIILDGGAQVNIMTSDLAQRLNLPRFASRLSIAGVNSTRSRARFYVNATILSRTSDTQFTLKCFVLPSVAGNIPNWPVDTSMLHIPHEVALADPDWAVQRPVDLLICGNHYWASWLTDSISLGPGLPILKETVFGHVVVGEQEPIPPPETSAFTATALDQSIRRFWEIEDASEPTSGTDDQIAAENHFASTHQRNEDGRFIVQLPFREDPRVLGESRPLAIRQFLALERRFDKKPAMRTAYRDILHDQLRRGWIEPVPHDDSNVSPAYYMPHHGVYKESSTTTKLRIVYNASAKTSSGSSLNDLLRIGPVVQPDLATILLRFRKHPYAMTADISKMYLQVMLDPSHANFQRFVWRDEKLQRIQDFRITRVCFGVASSPFLATRALIQLAQESERTHPLASEALRNSFYVDDCIISVESLPKAHEIQNQLIEVLKGGGFLLTKWIGNHAELQPSPSTEDDTVHINDSSTSTLGISWDSKLDAFSFRSPISPDEVCDIKRKVLSAIARLFDPLGLIGPIVIVAKMILQDAHSLKIGWDDPIPDWLGLRWNAFVSDLQHLNQLSIPRWVSHIPAPVHTELHAFADASQRAYGVAIYLVNSDEEGAVSSRLLIAKSRVAPITRQTIPKLELCGAHLAAELATRVRKQFDPDDVFFWTDSTIVLYWLNGSSDHYNRFVSKRVKEILMMSTASQWRHVPTSCNPADIISRGATPIQLEECSLWWHGPEWVKQSKENWPPEFQQFGIPANSLPIVLTETGEDQSESLLSKLLLHHSSLSKLQRIIAYCRRFITPKERRQQGILSPEELNKALERLIFMDQSENFPGVAGNILSRGRITLSQFKSLSALTPFVDFGGLIRVGGRLENSDMPFQSKHPLLLPKSPLTKLIVRNEHLKQCHAGPSLLLATLRQRFWPLSGRNVVRKIVHDCIRCTRANPRPLQQLMGDLPQHRVTLDRPFQITGVDYAGPIMYRPSVPRGAIERKLGLQKGYIAVFICMATKAAHIEFVTSLSTESFLAAFRRFASRRNTPAQMYSDCGTNFEGASRELAKLFRQEQTQQEIVEGTRETGTTWHFIPGRAPHHGGLWEACVKSVKYHLTRVVQHTNFAYEELRTILCQIEAILNSRPISLISDNPNEKEFLTPGHFLTGVPGNFPPDPNVTQIPENRLNLWQICQQRAQHFGKKFRLLYLNTLQQRSKWRHNQQNVKVGEIILFLDETQSGSKWVLGQVSAVHPGRDGKVRVLTIRTPRGTYTRAITKTARLSVDGNILCSNQS